MLNQELIAAYKETRAEFRDYVGWNGSAAGALQRARYAIQSKRVERQFENEPLVRVRVEPDDCGDFEDMCGDTFNPEANPDISPNILERQKKAYREKLEYEGVWFITSEFYDGDEWQHADSIGWIEGGTDDFCGYKCELQRAALEALAEFRSDECRAWEATRPDMYGCAHGQIGIAA